MLGLRLVSGLLSCMSAFVQAQPQWSAKAFGGSVYVSREETLPVALPQGQGYEQILSSENYLEAGVGGVFVASLFLPKTYWFGGYRYQHYWYTTSVRVRDYLENPEDLEDIPYRTDLLSRQHDVDVGVFREGVLDAGSIGLRGSGRLSRTSSSGAIEDSQNLLQPRSLFLEQTFVMEPWLSWSWLESQVTRISLYFAETRNHDSEFSNKTRNEWIAPSFAIRHFYFLPDLGLQGVAKVHWLEWIYNDPWQDQRDFSMANQLIYESGSWGLAGDLSYSMVDFPQDTVRFSRKCEGFLDDNPFEAMAQFCHRRDSLRQIHLGGIWNFWNNMHLTLVYQWKENRSSLKEYDLAQTNIILGTKVLFGDTKALPPLMGVNDGKNPF